MRVDDLLSRSFSEGGCLLLLEEELGSEFFDLSSGFAGELMQKFVNYDQHLAVVIDDLDRYSSAFKDLAREHTEHPHIRFFSNEEAAKEFLDSFTES